MDARRLAVQRRARRGSVAEDSPWPVVEHVLDGGLDQLVDQLGGQRDEPVPLARAGVPDQASRWPLAAKPQTANLWMIAGQ
jgi:hypothetical protein